MRRLKRKCINNGEGYSKHTKVIAYVLLEYLVQFIMLCRFIYCYQLIRLYLSLVFYSAIKPQCKHIPVNFAAHKERKREFFAVLTAVVSSLNFVCSV